MPTVKVLYFAVARERIGRDEEQIEIQADATVADLFVALAARHPGLAALSPILKFAVNQEFAEKTVRLCDGDEVALIPPVAGGAGQSGDPRPHVRISDAPLSLDEVVRAVSDRGQGGVVTFTGAVRRVSQGKEIERLEYEAYRPMAERELLRVAAEVQSKWPGVRIAIVHRVGVLSVGELAVVIAASAPHRKAAFLACEHAIDALKKSVPIWKKEFSTDGAVWIGLGP